MIVLLEIETHRCASTLPNLNFAVGLPRRCLMDWELGVFETFGEHPFPRNGSMYSVEGWRSGLP
jgi:hypothetical protein